MTQIADFLKRPLSDDVIDRIVQMCSFQSMKNDPRVNPDMVLAFSGEGDEDKPYKPQLQTDASFMRKGETDAYNLTTFLNILASVN